jgi:hypothetical protein
VIFRVIGERTIYSLLDTLLIDFFPASDLQAAYFLIIDAKNPLQDMGVAYAIHVIHKFVS